MTFYFVGGEMTSFLRSDATSGEGTAGGTYDTAFARCCMVGSNNSNYMYTPELSLPDTFYLHFEGGRYISLAAPGALVELRAGGTGVFRVVAADTSLQMQRWNGSAWVNAGSAVTASMTTRQEIDLYIDGNTASGTAKLYLSGTLRETASVDLSLVTAIDEVRIYGNNNALFHYVSQMIIADEPTIGMRLASYYPTANGSTSGFTGGYTTIDETVLSDADFAYGDTNGQVSTFAITGPALTGYIVRAVAVWARSKCGALGPQNLQLALRVNGTDYFSGSKLQDVGYSAYGNIWETNPDTASDWLSTEIATLQPGVKAVT